MARFCLYSEAPGSALLRLAGDAVPGRMRVTHPASRDVILVKNHFVLFDGGAGIRRKVVTS